ncbi:MAG TPA: DUF3185 family protein [Opitutaceae bacterium]|nr:DUF3185 family protein [Opitutaceae bacterium]
MKTIIAIVLIIAGVAVFSQGLNRKDSIAGHVSEASTNVANAFDGGARQPRHIVYMVVGGVLVLAGIGMVARRNRPVIR